MDSWYYATAGGQGQGPVPASQLRELHARRVIGQDTLLWRDGMAEWQPLAEVAAEIGLPGSTPPLPAPGPYAAPQAAPAATPAYAAPAVPPVETHLVWAILTTLFCCWPFGVVAIVYACKVDRRRAEGDLAGALHASRMARMWATWSALVVVIGLAAFMFIGLLGNV